MNNTVLDLLLLQPSDRVLDIGFGGGYLLNRMSFETTKGFLAGVDISPAMVTYGNKRYKTIIEEGKLELKCGAVETLPYPDERFTKVSSVNSIFYWKNVEQGICEIQRVLVAEGFVVLCFTEKASIEKKSFAKNIRVYEAVEIERMMKICGFRDVKTASFTDRYRQYNCITGKKAGFA